jgi:moderate conductance mechanosensitive channel
MRLRLTGVGGASRSARRLVWLAMLAWVLGSAAPGRAADAPPIPSAPHQAAPATPAPAGDMSSAGWLGHVAMQLESEAVRDVTMLPDTSTALAREWRSFDANGSALGALVSFGWVILAAIIALAAERGVARGLSRNLRGAMRVRLEGPTVVGLMGLLFYDILGLAVLGGVFIYSRHWLLAVGVTLNLILFAANILIRWRIAALVVSAVLRPGEPVARLIELSDTEAHRLARFLSATILAIVVLIGFGRYGLADEDSGAPHVIALLVATAVCGLYALIVFGARGAAEALIRGRDSSSGIVAAVRAGLARAWLPGGLTAVAGLMVFFVFGLSLGLLSYYHAAVSTLGVWLLLLVFERLTERGWRDSEAVVGGTRDTSDRLVARSFHRILRAAVLLGAAMTLAWIWIDAIELSAAAAARALQSSAAALGTLFVAYLAWELTRLAIDRHLQNVGGGPSLPGADDDDAAAPASRLQTILPLLRAAFGTVIAVLAVLIVLSRLGIDTAPLIAGAGVFGLAVSFGAQSLVRDIISGVFYMWDDAFRVGEYIDTGRLKGTVETLGIRSVKLRHQNGPLHTIPYGQLGAVTNLSRDFATIKFNLRLEPGTDIELVRKTTKQIGLAMPEENPEMAAEVMLPLKLQGIAEVVDNALVLRFKFTARPVKPSWVQREYLKRMYQVFAEKGISFASGAQILQTVPAPEPTHPATGGRDVPVVEGALVASAAGAVELPLAAPSRVA